MRYLLAGSDYFGSMSDDPIKEAFVCLTSSLTIFSALRKCHSVQGPLASVLVFDPHGLARLCGQRGSFARPGLQTGFLVHAQHRFPDPHRTRIEGNNCVYLGGKSRIPWDLGRQPQMMPPWFELMVCQN